MNPYQLDIHGGSLLLADGGMATDLVMDLAKQQGIPAVVDGKSHSRITTGS
ncbi:MAG: hypothetical protein ACLUD0_02865 [Eubacterium ramulus]